MEPVPFKPNQVLRHLEVQSPAFIPSHKSLEDISKAIRDAGLDSSNLIFGIDYTRSNIYLGEETFDGLSLHHLEHGVMNPYQQVRVCFVLVLHGYPYPGPAQDQSA